MITVSIVQVGACTRFSRVLTTEPNGIDETRSRLLCSLVREQDRRERRRRVIPGAVSEQRSWSGRLFSFVQIPVPVPCFCSCPSDTYRVHITAHRATKFKTTKFNSGGHIELFTKISTHDNNPLNTVPLQYCFRST